MDYTPLREIMSLCFSSADILWEIIACGIESSHHFIVCLKPDLLIYDGLMFVFCRSFYFGDVSSKRDPAAYLRYVFTLYDHYRKKYCSDNKSEIPSKIELPLVVNTPGWVKGGAS